MSLFAQGQPIPQSVVYESPAVRASFLAKVYGLLLVGLATATAGVSLVLSNPDLRGLLAAHPILGILVYFGIFFGCRAVMRVPGVNILALLAFTFFTGMFILGLPIWIVSMQTGSLALVYEAAAITGSIFMGLTLFTLVSRRDFSFMGGFLMTGFWALFGGMLVLMILPLFHVDVQAASLALAWVGAVIFSLFILYNTSAIMRSASTDDYAMAALMLYLNVINLFLFILQILSNRRN